MKNLTKELILETLHKNKDKINSLGVIKLSLFGSFARDEQTENSDIDFLVEFKKNRGNYRDNLDLLHFLEDTFERKIDLGEIATLRKELKPYIFGGMKYEAAL